MAKKKKRMNQLTPAPDLHKGISIGFRADSQALIDALDEFAESVKRSRNSAMIILLEKALRAEGLWPRSE